MTMTIPDIKIEKGLRFSIQKRVEEEDASLNYGSGMLETVLATPSLVALMIEGAVEEIDKKLPEGFITVGSRITVDHMNASVLGATVTIEGTVQEYDGRKVTLKYVAFDEVGIIGNGYHERMIVNKDAMMVKAHQRSELIKNKNY